MRWASGNVGRGTGDVKVFHTVTQGVVVAYEERVDVVWEAAAGGELDRVRVMWPGGPGLTQAIIGLLDGGIVAPGDTIRVVAVDEDDN